MVRAALRGLRSRDYEHPYDRRALSALESNAALSMAVSKLNQYGIERILRMQYAGSNIRLTGKAWAAACEAAAEVCRVLDIPSVPDLYVDWEVDTSSIVTVGAERPLVIMSSVLLDGLEFDELLFVLGHELGHVRSRHVVYSQIASVLPVLGDILKTATFGLGGLLSGGLQLSLNNWLRMSDFSADRAGMLACQDIDAACRGLIKLGGAVETPHRDYDIAGFCAQAREFGGYDFDAIDKLARVVSALRSEQPWTVMRASELIKWVDSGSCDTTVRRLARPVAVADAPALEQARAGEEAPAEEKTPAAGEGPGTELARSAGEAPPAEAAGEEEALPAGRPAADPEAEPR